MAELIKTYTFSKDKSFIVFNDTYYIPARHLTKIRSFKDGVQVYSNDNYIGSFGRVYFKNNQIQIYQNYQEVAYAPVNDKFFNEIASQLPKVDQWTF